MKILPVSDLHFEFHRDHGKSFTNSLPEADVVCLAGDIATPPIIVDALKRFGDHYKNVLYVKGNHDCYGSSILEMDEVLKQFEDTNIHILENSNITIDEQRFIGCSLWFPWDPDNHWYRHNMSDFSEIKKIDEQVYERNRESVKYLNSNITKSDWVMTHYLPSQKCVAPEWKGSQLNRFFVCEIDKLIFEEEPKIWQYGHTHTSGDFILGGTRMICNPYGYHRYDINKQFNENLIIEI